MPASVVGRKKYKNATGQKEKPKLPAIRRCNQCKKFFEAGWRFKQRNNCWYPHTDCQPCKTAAMRKYRKKLNETNKQD